MFLLTFYVSTALPSRQVRFYLFRLEDPSGTLTVQSRTLRSGANDNVSWLNEISQGYSWQRAEATFSSSNNTKVREDQDLRIYRRATCASLAWVHLATSLCRCNNSGSGHVCDLQHMRGHHRRRFEFKYRASSGPSYKQRS